MGNYQKALELYEKIHIEYPDNLECKSHPLRYVPQKGKANVASMLKSKVDTSHEIPECNRTEVLGSFVCLGLKAAKVSFYDAGQVFAIWLRFVETTTGLSNTISTN